MAQSIRLLPLEVRVRPRPLVTAAVVLLLAACSSGTGDGGPSTEGTLPAGDHVHALRADDDGALLLGLHGGLWRSPDGRSWEQLGLEGQDAMALGVAAEGQPLLVGGHDLLARSTDGGETFEQLAPPDLPSLDIHALAQAPSEPQTVYAYVVSHGIYRSRDAGETWVLTARVGEQLPGDIAAIAVDPTDPEAVVLGSGGQGVLRSTDGAASFTRTSDWGTLGLAFGADGAVLAATYQGVDVSTDRGQSWENLVPREELAGQPLAVAVGPDRTWWMLTESPRVLYRSVDGDGDFEELARA